MAEDLDIDGVLQGLSAVVFNDARRVLMLNRSAKGEAFKTGWEFVKGGIKAGETRLEAAFREIGEETGLTDFELIAELPRVYLADVRYRKKKYHSVEKKTVVFFYRSGEVYLDRQEHSEYRWMTVEEAREVCWVEYGAAILTEAYEAFMQWRAEHKNL